MKAQSAIEFITAYSWTIILLLLAVFVAFYYLSAQQPMLKCDFGTDLPCLWSKLFQNTTEDIRFAFQLNNGMGKAIAFSGTQQITVNNIGNNGVNNYTGICWGNSGIIKGGDPIYCAFDITDTAIIPPTNRVVPLDIALSYVDCETSPKYPTSCLGGLNRTVHGTVTATFEAHPTGVVYCADGVCNGSKNYLNCPIDCPATCGPDCSFGHTGICNTSCEATCSPYYPSINPACNNIKSGHNACSNSTGGTSGVINFQAPCCGGLPSSIKSCGNMQYCSSTTGNCTICLTGWGNCDSNSTNGCEDNLLTDSYNCGSCGYVCVAGTGCVNGQCLCSAAFPLVYPACYDSPAGSANCSNSTGGTSNLINFQASCCNGTITNCGQTQFCSGGSCATCTSSNLKNCDQNSANGCEINTNTNMNNCGGCGTVCSGTIPPSCPNYCGGAGSNWGCSFPGAASCTKTCTLGSCTCTPSCGSASCSNCGTTQYCSGASCATCTPSNLRNCDQNSANGCEINTNTNMNNCGGCGNVCSGTTSCPSNYCITDSPSYAYTYPATCTKTCSGGSCSCTCPATPTSCDKTTISCSSYLPYCSGESIYTYPASVSCYKPCSGASCGSCEPTCTASVSETCSAPRPVCCDCGNGIVDCVWSAKLCQLECAGGY
ncbi:hypothetical protein H0N99_02815 [Candidatus Micrarchaeota archaeon]|nr:hypothetical protein [Candidatus Micrarchaeota archaeon]